MENNLKQSKFEMKLGGRTNGQTIENAFTFLKYLDELENNKIYGISKCGNITLLTKNEVVLKAKIEKKINEFKEVSKAIRDKAYGENNIKYDLERIDFAVNMLQELLED